MVRHCILSSVAIFQSTLPAGEATYAKPAWKNPKSLFQSTLPAGEATQTHILAIKRMIFQSTLPAGEATTFYEVSKSNRCISIHASRGGSDEGKGKKDFTVKEFQSTLPAGEAT